MNQLISKSKIVQCVTVAAGAAGTSAINGSVVDFKDAEGALIIVQVGAITSGGVQSIKFQHGDASNLSDAADVAGSAQTIADDDDGEVFYLDIRRPIKRYGRLVISRATQNSAFSAVAVVYGLRDQPATQPLGVSGEKLVSPDAGTA